ncbi:MAG: hypothetical protein ACTSRY_06630 [Alphaproteobacteria bacterium]
MYGEPHRRSNRFVGWGALGALLALGLGGCAEIGIPATMVSAQVTSLVNTDKSLTGHLVSYATGMDCGSLNFAETGTYCREPKADPPPEPPRYCYRTLGEVNCYDRPDPYAYSAAPRS